MQADIDELIHPGQNPAENIAEGENYEDYILSDNELSDFITNKLGFTINPEDRCVANKVINGAQCTILWHVDDLKLLHIDQSVLDQVLAKLNERFGKEQPLTKSGGKVHDYLRMRLDYTTVGQVAITTMYDYIDNVLADVPSNMQTCTYALPATANLFNVNDNAKSLNKQSSEDFHT